MPGSATDLELRRARMWVGWVLLIRHRGERLSAAALQSCEAIHGGLLMFENAPGRWNAIHHDLKDTKRELLFLGGARLVKDRDGCRQYQGTERKGDRLMWPQTWLCAISRERLDAVVQAMTAKECKRAANAS